MRHPVLPIFLLSAVILLAIAHFIALNFFLYWKFNWFDIPVHILGGIIVSLGVFSLRSFGVLLPERYLGLVPVISTVLIVGLLWETFEIWAGIPLIDDEFEIDTVSDLFMDVVGGVIGYIVGRNIAEL